MLNICSWIFSRFTCFDLRECVAARGQPARLHRRPLLQSASGFVLPLFRCIGSPPWYEIITQIHVEESNLILLIKSLLEHICYDNASRMFQRTKRGSYYPCCQCVTLLNVYWLMLTVVNRRCCCCRPVGLSDREIFWFSFVAKNAEYVGVNRAQ